MDRKQIEKGWSSFIYPFSLSFLSVSYLFAIPSFSYPVFKCFSLVIIFLFLRWGQVPILRSIQYITYKYGDFQKASRISHVETSIPINSIVKTHKNAQDDMKYMVLRNHCFKAKKVDIYINNIFQIRGKSHRCCVEVLSASPEISINNTISYMSIWIILN